MTTTTAQPATRTGQRAGALALGLSRGGLELKQFVRTREYLVFTLLLPVIIVVIFGAVFTFPLGNGVQLSQYFVSGMIASTLLSTGFQNLAIQIPIERDRGVLKRLIGTPMPKAAYFIGKIVMVLVVSIAEIAIILALSAAFYGLQLPHSAARWLTFGWVALLGITACTLCGVAFSSLARTGRGAPAVATPIVLVLQFTSGVFIQYTTVTWWLRDIAAVFPLKWMCQGMRSVFLPDAFAGRELAHSWELGRVALVLGAWCVAGLVLCLFTFRWTNRRER